MNNNIIYAFLSSFFRIFNAILNEYTIEGKKVVGKIRWKDENETQTFSWEIQLKEPALKKLKQLCEYLIKYDLIHGDRIIITENELEGRLFELGWDKNEAQRNINSLSSVEVKMIDEGEETDSFFVHF
jgi:hypothetical protein